MMAVAQMSGGAVMSAEGVEKGALALWGALIVDEKWGHHVTVWRR